jgi:cellulose biosynthesis protein BcsQ
MSRVNSRKVNHDPLIDFGARFKEVFGNIKNKEIASRLGVSRPAVTAYAQGRIPSAEKLIEISELTGCNLHWLLTGEGPKQLTDHLTHGANRAKVLLFHCSKGGVGTSTAALLIAMGLANRGYKTLLLDNINGTCTRFLFPKVQDDNLQLTGVTSGLMNYADPNPGLLVSTSIDRLDLVVFEERSRSRLLKKKIKQAESRPYEVMKHYSFIVLDAHSHTNPFYPTTMFMVPIIKEAMVFIPYEPNNSNTGSVQNTLEYVRIAKLYSPEIQFAGLFYNRYDPDLLVNMKVHKEVESLVRGKILHTAIHRSRELLLLPLSEIGNFYKTASKAALEYAALVDEMLRIVSGAEYVRKKPRSAS